MVNSVCCTVFQHFVKILFALNNTVLNSLDDIVDVYDRVYLYAKVFISLFNSREVGVKSLSILSTVITMPVTDTSAALLSFGIDSLSPCQMS